MRILLAEDDLLLGQLVEHMLRKKGGHDVERVSNGGDAYDFAMSSHYDVIILDWMMPDKDGIAVCKELRKNGYTGAILMLTAKDTLTDRVQGLDAGADDYLVKPFEYEELFARLRALSRRNYAPILEEVTHVNGCVLNRSTLTFQRNGIDVQLTKREFQLLDLLIQNQGNVLTREVILDRVWGYDSTVVSNAVDSYIKILRKKIDIPGEQPLIRSIRGVGYCFEK